MHPLENIRCFLLDMDGTLYLGDRLLPGVDRFFKKMAEKGYDFLYLTNNSSKSKKMYSEKLARLGLPCDEKRIFTSGEATRWYLKRHHREAKRIFVVGTPALCEEFEQDGFIVTEEQADLLVLGFDTSLDYRKLWAASDFIRKKGYYIATHPDLLCPLDRGAFMPDIGCMIAFLEKATGVQPQIIGKPSPRLIESLCLCYGYTPEGLMMVGDRLYTDIALGKNAGIKTCLVLTGETTETDYLYSQVRATMVMPDLAALAEEIAGFKD